MIKRRKAKLCFSFRSFIIVKMMTIMIKILILWRILDYVIKKDTLLKANIIIGGRAKEVYFVGLHI
jgi:hypothetical protein